MRAFDVNNDEVIAFTAKLEKLHKSAFPSAVRNTLNDVALEHKRLIPLEAAKRFEHSRRKTFFKKITGVQKAKGWSISKMKAISGLDPSVNLGDGRKSDRIISNLEAQEKGGMVRGRKLITHDDSRTGGNKGRTTKKSARHDKVSFHNSSKAFRYQMRKSGSKKSAYIAAIMSAKKAGKTKMLLKAGRKKKSGGMVYSFGSVTRGKNGNIKRFKTKKLYSYRENSSYSNSHRRTFISSSISRATKDMDKYFKENAEFQFKKQLKKR